MFRVLDKCVLVIKPTGLQYAVMEVLYPVMEVALNLVQRYGVSIVLVGIEYYIFSSFTALVSWLNRLK